MSDMPIVKGKRKEVIMTDDQKAPETPVTETPEAPMPSADQKTGETTPPEADAPKEEAAQDKGLPESASERTKREFEKLQTQLREERAKREYAENVFKSLQVKKEPEQTLPPFYDPETGMIDNAALSERDRLLLEAQQRAARAEQSIQQYVADQENREMYKEFPELVPSSEGFQQELHDLTRAIALDSMVNPDNYGKQLSGVEAARRAKSFLTKGSEQAKAEGKKEALEDITPKEQAALEATGSSGRRSQVTGNLEELRDRSRRGDEEAIMERLKRLQG